MTSEFFRRKMRTFIKRFDVDGDGVVTRDDFRIMADRGSEDNLSRRETTREAYIRLFEALCPMGGVEEKMDEESLIKAGPTFQNDPQFKKTLDAAIEAAFGLLDTNGDGSIQEEEYIRFLNDFQFRDHENIAKIVFRGLDTNHDGELSFEEFRNAIADFWLSEDETRPGTIVWGPLVEA